MEAATAMIIALCGGEAGSGCLWRCGAGLAAPGRHAVRAAFPALPGRTSHPPEATAASSSALGFATAALDDERIVVDVPPWRNDVAGAGGLDQPPSLDPARARDGGSGCGARSSRNATCWRRCCASTAWTASRPCPCRAPPSCRRRRSASARRALPPGGRLLAARGLAECVTMSFVAGETMRHGSAPCRPACFWPTRSPPIWIRCGPRRWSTWQPPPRATPHAAPAGWICSRSGQAMPRQGRCWLPPDCAAARCRATGRHRAMFRLVPGRQKLMSGPCWQACGVPMESLSVTADAPAHYHPGRSGTVRQGPKAVLACFGELHPALCAQLALPSPACAFEVFLDAIAEPKRRRRAAPDLPTLQPVARDFAFIVPNEVAAASVLRAAAGADRALIASVRLFDVYEGDVIAAGHKSLGVEVVFQPMVRTMADEDIEAASSKVVQAVVKATGASLR